MDLIECRYYIEDLFQEFVFAGDDTKLYSVIYWTPDSDVGRREYIDRENLNEIDEEEGITCRIVSYEV